MKILKKDLQSVTKELKALVKKTESLMKAVDRIEKAQTTKAKKAPPKKAIKSKAVKKVAVKKTPAKKKAAKVTATDTVINIIKRSKKGVDVPTVMKKTGFDEKKVRNIVFRVNKQGRIKRVTKGIYVAA